MIYVAITVDVAGKKVALDQVKDARIRAALTSMAENIGRSISNAKCPEHGQSPTRVRVHVGKGGDADLAYESCCEKLRAAVTKTLG